MRNTITRTRSRKPRRVHVPAYRVRLARLASKVDRDRKEAARFRYVHEHELTSEQREEIGEALRGILANRFSGGVEPVSDIEVAYLAGFYLSAAWLLFGATEVPDLAEVFDRHGLLVHQDWWLSDGWGDYFDKWGVKCEACGSFTFATPPGFSDKPADADWPEQCVACHAALPKQHHTNVFGEGSVWWVTCSCGWEPEKSYKSESVAKGQVTRHLKSEGVTSDA